MANKLINQDIKKNLILRSSLILNWEIVATEERAMNEEILTLKKERTFNISHAFWKLADLLVYNYFNKTEWAQKLIPQM